MSDKVTQAWAIKAPDGKFVGVRLSQFHIDELMQYLTISRGENIVVGYRCIRVNIQEVQE